jgi:digeranylgeranylglycerophospholipid reductase
MLIYRWSPEVSDSDARFEDADIQMVTGGICPASGTLNKIVDNGVMIVGDAAGQLMPLTGAGVQSGIEAGRISGEVAAQSVEEGDVSASRLSMYERRFNGKWGERIRNSRRARELLDRLREEDLNILPRVISGVDLVQLANRTAVKRTIAKVMTRSLKDTISLLKPLLFPE